MAHGLAATGACCRAAVLNNMLTALRGTTPVPPHSQFRVRRSSVHSTSGCASSACNPSLGPTGVQSMSKQYFYKFLRCARGCAALITAGDGTKEILCEMECSLAVQHASFFSWSISSLARETLRRCFSSGSVSQMHPVLLTSSARCV
ncbi:hypothetical protein JAAARDRAFT_244544 [Jaapia argillacea MUCL 33604]|uniref:Uncharacterized protein n=1 Tax=Jaapia argillacea MUCL 33604 TaxID=933084 RepID=A0A067QFP5_9AGAM|nr:hypothetical protein JAAARDRAFT_244544 [Jaapia argillacea MUCL 33604]